MFFDEVPFTRSVVCVVALAVLGCARGVGARSPECNAIINRCIQSCGDRPEVLSPREQTVSSPEGTNTQMNSCEASCQSKC
jgi:hypothetical protein